MASPGGELAASDGVVRLRVNGEVSPRIDLAVFASLRLASVRVGGVKGIRSLIVEGFVLITEVAVFLVLDNDYKSI